MQNPAPAQRITLDAAKIHAEYGRKLMRTLRSRMSAADADDVYQTLMLLISTTAKHSFDPEKSPLGPEKSFPAFLFGVLLRNAIGRHFLPRNEICATELQTNSDADADENDAVSLALNTAGECDTAEARVALDWFERAVGRELADTELTVFQALGVAGILENSAEDRTILCADLGMQDQSVVKIINRVKRVIADLWPAHFDVPLPCSRPLRTTVAVTAVPVQAVVAPPAVTAVAAVSAPALATQMPMQQLDLFADPAVSTSVSAPAIPAAPLGCPMPPVATDPIIVRLPVPVLELVKAQSKAAMASAPWPAFVGYGAPGQALRQAA